MLHQQTKVDTLVNGQTSFWREHAVKETACFAYYHLPGCGQIKVWQDIRHLGLLSNVHGS